MPLEAKNCFHFPEEIHQTEVFSSAITTVASHNCKMLQNTEKIVVISMLILG